MPDDHDARVTGTNRRWRFCAVAALWRDKPFCYCGSRRESAAQFHVRRVLTMNASPLIRQAVVDTVSRLCCAIDERDWVAMRLCLADTLATDYSRFRGTPAEQLTAEEFVRLRQSGLAGLRTQHLCFNHLVTLQGGRAHCRCDFIIHRWPERTDDARFFHTYGYYHYDFVSTTGDVWLIESITQFAVRSEGSPELHGAHRSRQHPPPITSPMSETSVC
jgi:hypothetical protein